MRLLILTVLSGLSFYYLKRLRKPDVKYIIDDDNIKELLEEIKNYKYV